MEIIVNGHLQQVQWAYTAAQLVEDLELAGKRIAMEVNQEIVPRSQYGSYGFQSGDKIEIVHAIGGG